MCRFLLRRKNPRQNFSTNMSRFVNFSGRTEDHPDLLKYSCQVECRWWHNWTLWTSWDIHWWHTMYLFSTHYCLSKQLFFFHRVRPVKPARIWSPRTTEPQEKSDGKINSSGSNVIDDLDAQSQSISVLLSRPIFALEFSSLRMHVDAPKIVVPHCKKKKVGYSST